MRTKDQMQLFNLLNLANSVAKCLSGQIEMIDHCFSWDVLDLTQIEKLNFLDDQWIQKSSSKFGFSLGVEPKCLFIPFFHINQE